ncbi:MAG: nuclear transport factor 2 family protein [Wenzhouxiangellaceae bacterium]
MATLKPSGRCLMALLLFALLACPAAFGHDDPVENRLHKLLDEFLGGASRNDAEMHARFWADDLIYTSSAGERFGKAEIMRGFEDPGRSGDAAAGPINAATAPTYSAHEVDIRVFGELAVVTFRLCAETGPGHITKFFNTGVLVLRNGEWKAISWQATRIPNEISE